MKVLFAVNNEKISDSITKRYQKEYKEIISGKNVYYFNAILKEIQKDKSYDRIVISEDLEPFSNNNYEAIDKFIFEKLDTISDEAFNSDGANIPIIVISTDRRSRPDSLLARLFGIGVYDTLVGQDRSVDKVCELLNKPRSKKEAKSYYKIGNENFEYKQEKENAVSEEEIQNILAHYNKIGGNEEKYIESFNSIAVQYTDEQLKIIIPFLPQNVTNVLSNGSAKYQQLMGITANNTGKKNKSGTTSKAKKEKQIEFIEKELNKQKLTKPVIIPTTVDTSKVKKIVDKKNDEQEELEKQEIERKKEEKRKKQELAKKKEEERKKQELAKKKEEERKKQELAKKKEEERKKQELAKKKEEERKKQELAKKKEEERKKQELAEKKEEERKKQELAKKEEEKRKQELAREKEEKKKRRGRPPKNAEFDEDEDDDDDLPNVDKIAADKQTKRRGRPANKKIEEESEKIIKKKDEKESIKEDDEEDDILELIELDADNNINDKEIEEDDDNILGLDDEEDDDDEIEEDYDDILGLDEEDDDEDDEIEEDDDDDILGLDDEEDDDDEIEDDDDDILGLDDEEDDDDDEIEDDDDDILGLDDEDEDDEIEEDDDDDILGLDDEEDDDEIEDDDDDILGLDEEEDDDDEIEEDDDDDILGLEEEEEEDDDDDEIEDDDDDILGLDDEEDDDEIEEDDDDDILGLDDEEDDDEIEEDDDDDILGLDEEDDDDEDDIDSLLSKMASDTKNSNAEISNPNFVKLEPLTAQRVETINQTTKEIENVNKLNSQVNFNIDNLIGSNQKLVAFIGTSKNGTSFLVNNLAELLSEKGIKTAIVDLTKNRNAYYIYTDNKEERRTIAHNCINNLRNGQAQGIQINKNLDVYTTLPDETDGIEDCGKIVQTLLNNYSLVLLDCDFETDYQYFNIAQEIYLVQSLDILTIQPLTAFLRELKAKGILDSNKLRVVLNKYIRLKQITEKAVIGGMSSYNDPSMSFMTELFNKDNIKYTVIPFEPQVYAKYLDSLYDGSISIKGYSKNFVQSLGKLANMVFPLINGTKKGKEQYVPNSSFSPDTNYTLGKMKKNIK